MKTIVSLILILLLNIFAFAQKSPITVYLAGDSTMAQKQTDKRPETGWGEMLQQHFLPEKVKIDNRALNGRSTKSFMTEGRWQAIIDVLKKGDYVFIEFGHNDEKKDKPEVYAEANTDYRKNLIKFIEEVRAKNAFPVLLTPVMRRSFNEKGVFVDSHGQYPDSVRAVAREYKVPLIDMHRKSEAVLEKLGPDESRTLFLQLKPGENPNYPKGVEDNTHFNPKGADMMANLAVDGIRETGIGLKKFLKK